MDKRVIHIGDTDYTIRPLTVGVYAEMEAYIVAQRGDPLLVAANAVEKVPPQHHAAIWDAAMKQAVSGRTVTAEEASAFENSVNGLSWKVWQCMKRDHAEIDSVEAARNLLLEAGEKHFDRIASEVEIGSGEADLKNSDGPEVTTPGETDQVGQSSTDSSPKFTDGDRTKLTN